MSSKKKKPDAEVAQATVEVSPELDVEELEGIGRVTGAKLKERGYHTVRDIAFASAKELAEVIGNEERAAQIIEAARKMLGSTPSYPRWRCTRGGRRSGASQPA